MKTVMMTAEKIKVKIIPRRCSVNHLINMIKAGPYCSKSNQSYGNQIVANEFICQRNGIFAPLSIEIKARRCHAVAKQPRWMEAL